jgi:hypothetical protein
VSTEGGRKVRAANFLEEKNQPVRGNRLLIRLREGFTRQGVV